MNTNQKIHAFLNKNVKPTVNENIYIEPKKKKSLRLRMKKRKPKGEAVGGLSFKTIYP